MAASEKRKDCAEPICASKKDAMRSMFTQAAGKGAAARPVEPCPPDREELGHHSWTLLHTLAAYYPDAPSEAHKETACHFLRGLAALYPCTHCAEEFRSGMEQSPPRVDSRESLSVWLCESHNRVNQLLGKPEFECVLSKLDLRWRHGGPKCDAGLEDDHA
mmetsp:Transcript_33503/g.75803  ORF Transcript_33503/g.75803 Transcript_33503/m.75803 type:complete len:161 (-) Transcript_33503:249-731(-)